MPWQESTVMRERQEFVGFAQEEGANISELCRRFGISRKTAYKWLGRAPGTPGAAGDYTDRSRRPHTSPRRTPPEIEAAVLAVREAHPAWGARKIQCVLARQDALDLAAVPATSTITAILRRHDRLPGQHRSTRDYHRFVAEAPNDLWQIDFMGQPDLPTGKVYPLTVLDDHSRFAVAVIACPQQQEAVVRQQLSLAFARFGLPRRILTDNGPPWGTAGAGGITALEAWWLRLGIAVSHGRPHHPQTQGKVERLHRTLWAEVVEIRALPDLATAQRRFDAWRHTYNHERPHAALDNAVPASRYTPSPRPFPDPLPPLRSGPDDAVRKVQTGGVITFRGQDQFISRGLIGQHVAVRAHGGATTFTVWYGLRQVAMFDQPERS